MTADTLAPSRCPRCGIGHRDAPERDRADALCTDCREAFGPGWAQQARREVQRLANTRVTYRCGHPKTPANTYTRPDGRGRECLACKRRRSGRAT